LFRSIFEHANAGMNTITFDGRYLQVNPAFCRYLGYTREELSRLTVFDLTHPQDQTATRTQFAQIKAGLCHAFDYEKRFLRKDGEVVWGHVTSAWLFDELDNPLFGIGLVQDITDRKKAETDLLRALGDARQSRDKISGILRSLCEGLIVIDQKQHIALMSPSAEKLLGVTCEGVLNQPIDAIFSRGIFPSGLRQALVEGRDCAIYELELPGLSGNGPRSIQARLSAFRDSTGNPCGRIAILQDVTSEREVSRMKTEFVTTAAHELRTPLTSIQGFSDLLLQRSELTPEEQRGIHNIIHGQAEILAKIVDDLLDLSRIETGTGFDLRKSPCDLSDLLLQAISHVPRDEERHRIEVRFATDLPTIHADPVKLRQVLENVLTNAVKFSPRGGLIKIEGYRKGGELRLSVHDQGIGMSKAQVSRIFEKFYRADTSNTAVGGVGLGMNIVKEIVEAHGGNVWVNSIPGRGTTVNIGLPTDAGGDKTGADCVFDSGLGGGKIDL
jgi:PAS domain S-box-containing protein